MVSLFSYSGICQLIPLVTRINTFSWVLGEQFMSPGLNGQPTWSNLNTRTYSKSQRILHYSVFSG